MTALPLPARPSPPRPSAAVWGAVLAATLALLATGCAAGAGAGAGSDSAPVDAAELLPPSPDLPFPCSLIGADEVTMFLGPAELTEVDRTGTTAFITGCTWSASDGTGSELDFRTDVSERAMDSVLEAGPRIDDLAGPAVLLEDEVVLDDDSAGFERQVYAVTGDTRFELEVRAADPSAGDVVALAAVVQARLAAASGPAAAEGVGLAAADLRICQDVVAQWDRPYSVLVGSAQVVSSVSKYTDGLVEYAAETGPELTDPDLAAAYARLAAASPADPADPTPAEVDAIRVAVEDIGSVCAAGGVQVDWLPR